MLAIYFKVESQVVFLKVADSLDLRFHCTLFMRKSPDLKQRDSTHFSFLCFVVCIMEKCFIQRVAGKTPLAASIP